MAQSMAKLRDGKPEPAVNESDLFRLDMGEAEGATDAERQKDSRMYGELFVRFTARVEAVEDGFATLSVLKSNSHERAPEAGATVHRDVQRLLDRPEWTRTGGS